MTSQPGWINLFWGIDNICLTGLQHRNRISSPSGYWQVTSEMNQESHCWSPLSPSGIRQCLLLRWVSSEEPAFLQGHLVPLLFFVLHWGPGTPRSVEPRGREWLEVATHWERCFPGNSLCCEVWIAGCVTWSHVPNPLPASESMKWVVSLP